MLISIYVIIKKCLFSYETNKIWEKQVFYSAILFENKTKKKRQLKKNILFPTRVVYTVQLFTVIRDPFYKEIESFVRVVVFIVTWIVGKTGVLCEM